MRELGLAKTLRYLVYATAFVPLIVFSQFISPFHFGKVVIFRSIIYVMIALYIMLILKDRSYLPKVTKVGWSFFFFAVAFSTATATSIIPYSSFWGSLERMGGLFTFWHYFIFFIILTSVFRTEAEWINLFKVTIGAGIISAFYGFGQRTDIEFFVGSGGRSRIFGTIGNPALFAGYQIVNMFLALTLFFRLNNGPGLKFFYGSAVLVNFIAIMMTAVRGSILAVGVGFLIFALLYSSAFRSKKAKKVLLGLIGILILFVTLALLLKNTSFVRNSSYLRRITEFSLTNYTVQTRFWAWEAGIKGWKETPKTVLLGWGPENFNIPFSKYFNPKFFRGPGSETLFDRAHNMFVEILVTMGIMGLVAYVWIFLVSIKVLWGKITRKDTMIYGVGLISLLIAYAIHNSFIFDTSANFIVFFTVLGFISFISLPKNESDKKVISQRVKVNQGLQALLAAIFLLLAVFGIYFINIRASQANYITTRAIVKGWDNDFAGAIAKHEEALSYNVPGKYEYRHRFAQYVLEKTNSGKLTPEYKEAIFKAIKEVEKNLNENKVDYLPYLYLSRLYIILGKEDPASEYNDKSLEYSLATLDLAPDFVRAYYEIGQGYLNKKDLAKASEYFRRAAELNPEVGLSHWYWGVVEIERGNTAGGLEIIEKIIASGRYIPAESDLNRLVSIYLKKGDLSKLVWVYEILVDVKPDSPQYRASLAVAYARVGNIDKAVGSAKKAAELDPSFEPEARSFVQSLGRSW